MGKKYNIYMSRLYIAGMSVLFIVLCLLSGCKKTSRQELPIVADIIIDNHFGTESPETAGLFIYSDGRNSGAVCKNVKMNKSSDGYRSENMLNLDVKTNYDICFYAPFNDSATENEINTDVLTDQSNVENISLCDHIFGTADHADINNRIQLDGRHLMSQVEIVIETGSAMPSGEVKPIDNVVLKDFYYQSITDLSDGSLGLFGDTADIICCISKQDANYVAKCLVVPQCKKIGNTMFLISGTDFSMEIEMPEDVEFESGKKHCFRVDIRNGMSVQYDVLEWDEHFLDLDDDIYPEFTEVYDVDGNRYGVTEIDGKYWMSENLKTTHLNDGTPLDLVLNANDWGRWEEENKAACYYNFEEADNVGKGMFYTWSVVKSGKLCPSGWRVPSREEWLAMREFAGGEYQAGAHLKSKDGWKNAENESRPEYQGDDIYGFHAIPTGFVDDWGSFDHSKAGYGPESISYYWSSSESSEIRPYFYTIYYMAPNLVEDTSPVTNYGMSVRCIRDINN